MKVGFGTIMVVLSGSPTPQLGQCISDFVTQAEGHSMR